MTGPGIHLTTEDSIVEHLIGAFNAIFNEYWWPTYTTWVSSTLDGETGVCTVDFSALDMPLSKFWDIRSVVDDTTERPISRLPETFIASKATGDKPRYIVGYPERTDKVFRVVPYTAVGTVHVNYRSRPTRIDLDTVLNVEEEYLVAAATYLYLADDGTNPGATQTAERRLQQCQRTVRDLLSDTVSLEQNPQGPVDFWWVS
jgi:hypothetical protein